jgi:RNA polymerase sigma-70 factor (ECF subfamily)
MIKSDRAKSDAEMSGDAEVQLLLVEKAKSGDRNAFELLMCRFQKDLFRMVYCRTRSRMDAEDLTQDIFLQALKSLSALNEPGRFRSWLFRIAVNRIHDHQRRKRFLCLFTDSGAEDDAEEWAEKRRDDGPGPLDQLMKQEFWRNIKRLSEKLSYWEREVFFLRFMDDLSIREIAEVLNKSESTVKTLMYRSLKKFKEDSALNELLQGEMP